MDYMLVRFFEFLLFTSQLDDSSRETKKAPAGASTWPLPTWPVLTLKKKGSKPNGIKDWTGSCSTNKNAPSKLKPQTLSDLLQADKWEEKKWCEIRSLGSHEHAMFCYTVLLPFWPVPSIYLEATSTSSEGQESRQWIQTTEHWIWLKFPNKNKFITSCWHSGSHQHK